ncbi:hypothetical protein D3C85_1511760 [compost metagenome]
MNVASVVHDVTTSSCASDRQLSPESVPPAQRNAATLMSAGVHAAWFDTTPSTIPSSPSQASRTCLLSSAVFAAVNVPPGAASALAFRLNAPMNPTQL